MDDNITKINYLDKEIILIATAHVSQESVELVKKVIEEEKPDSVCIELDEGRYKNIQDPKAWEKTDIVQVIKSKRVGFLLANMALSSYQRKIAKKLKVPVGGEMIQGMESAKEVGANLVLADRNIQTTFLRIWRKLGLWEKGKLLFSLLFSLDEEEEITDEELQNMLKQDMLESVLADMKKEFPKIGEILIHERDQYLATKIKEAPGKKIVAVLGGAHVPGIKKEIFEEIDMDEISVVPPGKPFVKVIGWLIPVLIIGIIIYGFTLSAETGLQQIGSWILWNGSLAALFTLLALGHPLSIFIAFVIAPISSLNPLIACGWFAGLAEAWIKKPTVEDVNRIPEDIFSLRGFFSNRFLKILMVVIMANLGSSIGTIVAGLNIIGKIF